MTESPKTARDNILECVAFSVSGQLFCLDIMMIREIRRWVSVTTLPHADPHVLGVINLRGNVIPVYDLAVRFGTGKTAPGPRNVVIICDAKSHSFGLLVESVSEILAVNSADIQDPPKLAKGSHSSLIEGLITVGDDMAQLIDIRQIASDGVEMVL